MTRRGMGAAHEIWNYATLLMILGQLGEWPEQVLPTTGARSARSPPTLSAVVGLHFYLLA